MLRLRLQVSTYVRPVPEVCTPDPARGTTSACTPSLSPSSSTGNRRRDLRQRSVTMGIHRLGALPDDVRIMCGHGRHWIGFAHLSVRGGMRQMGRA
jgi:hypothetical protein